jgi:GAF domain-containing protein
MTSRQIKSSDASGNGSTNPAFADELQLIVDGEQPLDVMLEQVAQLAKRLLPTPVEASVTLIHEHAPATLAFTGQVAMDLDETQYERGHGPCVDAAYGHQTIVIANMATERRWPDFVVSARDHEIASSLSVPMPVQSPAIAALNIYAAEPDAFDREGIEVATTIAEFAAIAVANTQRLMDSTQLARQMAEAMTSRSIIEQAKGILMATNNCAADAAFDILVGMSQHRHQKLREVAAWIIEQTAINSQSRSADQH